jgi:hypothetical protein
MTLIDNDGGTMSLDHCIIVNNSVIAGFIRAEFIAQSTMTIPTSSSPTTPFHPTTSN